MMRARGNWLRRGWTGLLAVPILAASACAGAGGEVSGEGGQGSFKGETIHFVVSFSPGGGYDIIARAIAPYLEKELGATVVVENEDGAGGLLAANQVYAAEPDGLTIGFFAGQGIAGAALGEAEGAQFDLMEYSYVCRLAADPRVMVAGPKSPYQTIEEVRSASSVKFASAGTGAADNIDATVLYPVLGIDGQIVTGYESSDATELAITSGDVDIGSGSVSSRLSGILDGEFRAVLLIGQKRIKELPDVPALLELEMSEEEMALAKAHTTLQAMGRMVWAPPGVPEDRLAELERAFAEASKNPNFLKKMERALQAIDFTSGAKARVVAESVLDAPENYKTLLKKSYAGQ